jgi:hypothetical protein
VRPSSLASCSGAERGRIAPAVQSWHEWREERPCCRHLDSIICI